MSKYISAQTNFKNGEIGAKALGQVLTEEYKAGVAWMENFIPHQNGGCFRRPGTIHQSDLPGSNIPFGIPFKTSDGNRYIIFVDNRGQTPSASDHLFKCFDVNNPSFEQVGEVLTPFGLNTICASLDPYGFHYTQAGDVLIVTHNSGEVQPQILKYVGNDARFTTKFIHIPWMNISGAISLFDIQLQSGILNVPYLDRNVTSKTMTPNSTTPTQLTSTGFFLGTMIGSYIKISQVEDTVCLITRTSESALVSVVSTLLHTITIGSGTTAMNTGDPAVIHSDGVGTTVPEPLQEGKVYYAIKISAFVYQLAYTYDDAIAGNYIELTSAGSGTIYLTNNAVDADIAYVSTVAGKIPMASTAATDNWALSSWNDFMGWPKTVSFYEQRLVFGGTKKQGSYLFGSMVGNIFHFMQERLLQDQVSQTDYDEGTPPTSPSGLNYTGILLETDPYAYNISTTKSSNIKWLVSGKKQFIGTDSSEGYISGGSSGILSNQNVTIDFDTSIGGYPLQAFKVNESLIFVGKDNKTVYDYIYYDTNSAYVAVNLNALNDEIINHNYVNSDDVKKNDSGILQAIYDSTRKCIWMITTNYQLIGMSYDRVTKMMAWHRHTIGGEEVEVRTITMMDIENSEYLYLGVKRKIGGVWRYRIEKMLLSYEEETTTDDVTNMIYIDGAVIGEVDYSSIGVDKAGRFPYLAGATDVQSIVNGRKHVEVDVVFDGSNYVADLGEDFTAGDTVVLGYPYTSKLYLCPLEAGGDFGPSVGTLHRTDRITIRFYRSMGLKYMKPNGNYIEIFDTDYTTNVTGDLNLFTGMAQEYIENNHEIDNIIKFETDSPFPCNILSITQRGVSYAG